MSLTWWRHQMETFSALLAFCAGNSPVTCPALQLNLYIWNYIHSRNYVFPMSETFWSSELKKNPCTQEGANVAGVRPWVGHAANIDLFIDIEQKWCIFISQIDFRISSIVPWFALWNIDSIHIMLRNYESSSFIIFLMKWLVFTMP